MADERLRISSTTEADTSPAAIEQAETLRQFMSLARERFQAVLTAESRLRADMKDDLQFRASEQWDDAAKKERGADDRPCLIINRLPQFIRQVTNAQRASNLSVKVTGVDDGADRETADTIQGMIRFIERDSDASVAYGTAGEHQATMGRGYWRIVTEYEGPKSFVQTIRIKRVRNPFSVFVDPAAQEADGSDATFAFVVEDINRREFKERWGADAMKSLEGFASGADGLSTYTTWLPDGAIKVAEYWYVESTAAELLLVEWHNAMGTATHTTPMFEEEFDAIPEDLRTAGTPSIIKRRTTQKRVIRQALITGAGILEGNEAKTAGAEWPGQWIPIVPVLGDEIDIDGRVDLRGMVRDAKDPQRLYNIQNSTLAETLALVPRAPYIGYEGQFEGHEPEWQQANRKPFAYLQVRPVSLDGIHPAPLPQRTSASADIGSIMAAIQQSDQDLKATMGLYEPSLGIRQSSGQSGKAIEALKKAGEQANSNFLDNMSRAIRFTGRIIIDLIPHIYDARRVVRIIGVDEEEKTVMVHAGDRTAPADAPKGIDGIYDLSAGRYDVAVSAGPSLETKRAEAFIALNGFVQAYPAAFPMLGDLLVGNLDWPGAKAAAERLKKAVPPGVLDDDDGGEIPPQVAAQMQQLMQQMEAMGIELQQAQSIIQSKQIEASAKAAAEREKGTVALEIARLRAEADAQQAAMQAQHEAGMARLEAELARVAQRLDHAHDLAMSVQTRSDNRADTIVGRRADERAEARKAARPGTGPTRPVPTDLTHAE